MADVWNSIHDIPEQNLEPLRSSAETARIITLPGSFNYDDSRDHSEVQPDVLIESPFCVVSVEAKRPTKAKFDPTQLARQALLLSRIAEGRPAYLWVILGSPPPIKLAKLGNQGLMEALGHGLQQIADPALSDLTLSRFDGYLGWSTWKEIVEVCRTKHRAMDGNGIWDECGKRIISSMEDSLRWHS